MAYLRARDIVSGGMAKVYAKIDGRVIEIFNIRTCELNVEKDKSEFKVTGKVATQYKAKGANCTGSMEYYVGSVSTIFTRMMKEYVKTGLDTYFDMTIVNEDPTTTIGKRTTVVYNVNLDSAVIASMDVDSDGLTESVDFTFDDFEVLDEFNSPIDYGN
ncbi:phage tail tube protein [Ruminococcaceae bacterium OttesenSCG-928-N02]|nr:phage tail tube protein [Ruminococcaceae bacterium OttesenSCG-928-N02]